jgi:hypothetical protein
MHTKFWSENFGEPHGILRPRWKDNIKVNLKEILCEDVD